MKAGQGVSCGRALRIFTLLEFHVRQYSAYPSSEGQCGVTPAPPPPLDEHTSGPLSLRDVNLFWRELLEREASQPPKCKKPCMLG